MGCSITESALLLIKIIPVCFCIKAQMQCFVIRWQPMFGNILLNSASETNERSKVYAWFGIPQRGCNSRKSAVLHSSGTTPPLPGPFPAPGVRSGSLAVPLHAAPRFLLLKGDLRLLLRAISALHSSTMVTVTYVMGGGPYPC